MAMIAMTTKSSISVNPGVDLPLRVGNDWKWRVTIVMGHGISKSFEGGNNALRWSSVPEPCWCRWPPSGQRAKRTSSD
jgi:hypothetical protein